MKNTILFFATIFFALTYTMANAQTTPAKTDSATQTEMNENAAGKFGGMSALQDGVMMAHGKMIMVKDGKGMMLDKEMILQNGTMVMQDGTLKMPDGTTTMMINGDHVDMNGNLVHNMDESDINTSGKGRSKMKSNDEKMKIEGHHRESKDKYDK